MKQKLTKESVVKSAKAFLGEYEGETISSEKDYDIKALAKRMGIVLTNDLEEDLPLFGDVILNYHEETSYSQALSVGAYLLYDRSIRDIDNEMLKNVVLFSLVTQFPEFEAYETATLDELIGLSIRLGIPIASLKILYEPEEAPEQTSIFDEEVVTPSIFDEEEDSI